jgi:hypothetical protein
MKVRSPRVAILLGAVAMSSAQLCACEYHDILGLPEPTAVWLSGSFYNLSNVGAHTSASTTTATHALAPAPLAPTPTDPAILHWKTNATGAHAFSTNTQINGYVSNIIADVDVVAYDSSYVYVHSSDVPSYNVGPFPGNPAYPSDKNQTVRITRTPTQQTGTHTAVGLGSVGVLVNGVDIFNALDAMTYQNDQTWHQIANVFEASSFDAGPGHPAPGQGTAQPGQLIAGTYHYHESPTALINQLDPGNTGQHHSPLLGYAFDGFPIYGSYGYANSDGTGGIVRETSSYQLRNITQRHALPDGTALPINKWGPDVSVSFPLGDYSEDYVYTPGSGTLDQYGGRIVDTPEYPNGTYAYFIPLDASGNNVYPYLLGPSYYGVVDTADLGGGSFSVPANVSYFFSLNPVPEPSSAMLLSLGLLLPTLRRRRIA